MTPTPIARLDPHADRLWSITDTSTYLGIPVGTLYQWHHRQIGPKPFRVGRFLKYDPADVRAWLRKQVA